MRYFLPLTLAASLFLTSCGKKEEMPIQAPSRPITISVEMNSPEGEELKERRTYFDLDGDGKTVERYFEAQVKGEGFTEHTQEIYRDLVRTGYESETAPDKSKRRVMTQNEAWSLDSDYMLLRDSFSKSMGEPQ